MNRFSSPWLLLLLGLTLLTPGCKKSGAPKAKSGSLAALKVPAGFVAYGGVDGPVKVLGQAKEAGVTFLPISEVALAGGIQKGLELKDAKAIDLNGKMRFAVLDPKTKRDKAGAVIFTIKDRKAFEAALTTSSKNADGNALKLQLKRGPAAYLNYLGDKTVVLTQDPKLFATHKGFLAQLYAAKLPGPAAIEVKVARIAKQFGAEMEQGFGRMKRKMSDAPIDPKDVESFIKTLLTESDTIRVRVAFPQDGARIVAEAVTVSGSTLQKIVKKLEPNKNSLYERFPQKTALVAGFSMSSDFKKLVGKAVGTLFSALPEKLAASGANIDLKKYLGYAGELWDALGSEMASAWFTGSDGKPVAGSVFALADGAKAKGALEKILTIYQDPMFKAAFAAQKVTAKVTPKAYTLDGMEVTTIEMGRPSMGMLKRPPQITHFAFGKKYGYFAQGAGAKTALEQMVKGKAKAPLVKGKGFKRAIAATGEKHLLMIYTSPADMMAHLMGPMAAIAGMGANKGGNTGESGVTLGLTATGGTVRLVADFPKAQIQSIAQTVMRTMSMFMGMRGRRR